MPGIAALSAALALALAGAARAAPNGSHAVTVDTNAVNGLQLTGGNLMLVVVPGHTGGSAEDLTTCDLSWATNQANKKITVASSLAAPQYALRVGALNVTGGTAAGQRYVNTTAQDFVTGITRTAGRCDLDYYVYVGPTHQAGWETHAITYTLVDTN